MKSKTQQEPRYIGTNWDAVTIEEKNGAGGKLPLALVAVFCAKMALRGG